MNGSSNALYSLVPSNKFYPPHIDEQHALFRSNLIEEVLSPKNSRFKVIAIEAQAGQGKTTLAYQYLNHYKLNHIWYQIGKEDADPVVLLLGLLKNLRSKIDGFSSPKLEGIINEGEIGPMDLLQCANILLGDIDKHLSSTLYIVFDDLHLIDDAHLTNNLLAYLLDTSPPNLHFVLTSRHPFELKSKTIRSRNGVSYLCTDDLALSSTEIETLFNDVFNRSISISDAQKIEDVTRGWVMGIVLAAHPMSGRRSMDGSGEVDLILRGSSSQKEILEYFQDEIFSQIPEHLHVPFLQLSFVDEIHIDLAHRITGVEDIGITLSELTQENLFIYNIARDSNIFRFHHLFQEFLQARAQKSLSKQEIKQIYTESASFFLERDMVEKALSCYLQGEEFASMDAILHQYGAGLLAQNRMLTLLTLLQSIPEEILLQYGWLTLFSGLTGAEFQPEKTLPHLESARTMFIKTGEETGELIALSQIIYYHFVVSGRYRTGASLLPRTEELLRKLNDSLTIHIRIHAQRNLAAGFCFFSANMEKARYYAEKARSLALENGIRNFISSTVFIKAYIELLCGNLPKFRRAVEACYTMTNDPLVSMSNKLSLRVMHLCCLSMFGELSNFFHQKNLLQEAIDERIVKQTVTAPYLHVWGGSCLISQGETSRALDLLNSGVGISTTAKSEHMLSQILQWQAYILALHGNIKSAETKISEASNLRVVAGGPFYQSFHFIIAGAIYSRLKRKMLARESFDRALSLAEEIPSPYLQCCCLLHRSYFRMICYGEKNGLADLKKGLEIMEQNEYDHFWSWEPECIQKILSAAVVNDIKRDFCRKLSRKRLNVNIRDDGTLIPIIHITMLNGFHLRTGQETKLTMDQLTPMQRELLGLILVAKDKKIPQEKVQLLLWPDSTPKKSRKKLDTLLGRLRASFSEKLALPIKDYLVLNNGILSLENSSTDIEDFYFNCELGFRHAAREENWQAGNRFEEALTLVKNTLPSDTFRSESVYAFEDTLLTTFERAALQYSKILVNAERKQEAINILEKLFRINPLSENCILELCKLYTTAYQPLKIRETLERYSKGLRNAEYEEDEVESMVNDVAVRLNSA